MHLIKSTMLIILIFLISLQKPSAEENAIKISKSQIQLMEGNQARYKIDFSGEKLSQQKIKLIFDGEAYKEIKKLSILPINSDASVLSEKTKEFEKTDDFIEYTLDKNISNKVWVIFSVRDDNKYTGKKSFKINHKINGVTFKTIAVSVHDDEESIACASLYQLETNCFDTHIGVRGIFDADGKLKTSPYYLLLARSKISNDFQGLFEAEYYELPALEKNEIEGASEPEQTGAFSKNSGIFKLSLSSKYDLGRDFSAVIKFGVKKVPQELGRITDATKFYSAGLEHQSFFGLQQGRGISGLAYSDDDYWRFKDLNTSEIFNYNKRIVLYGKLALNDKGSVMLSAYANINKDDLGPSEFGIALTYGGKWSKLLSAIQ